MKTTFTKVAVATVIAGTTLFGGTASAATKDEVKATERYTALKNGMTIEQTAKIIYGKDYKKQLTKKNGSTVFKKKEDYSTNEEAQKSITYNFFNEKTYSDSTGLVFMTKKNSSIYRLTVKSLGLSRSDSVTGFRESKMKLLKGKKIKSGMTEKQLDGILSGKGLGEWTSLATIDLTSIQTKKELDLGLGVKGYKKIYVFPTSTSKRKYVVMDYDFEKKIYTVTSQSTY